MANIFIRKININNLFIYLWIFSWLIFIFILPVKFIFNPEDLLFFDTTLFYFSLVSLTLNVFCYFLVYKYIKKINIRILFSGLIVLSLILALIGPLTSIDFFSYIYRARVFSEYGLNPYFETYHQFNYDVFYSLINNLWSDLTSPYGPLFVLFSSFLTFIGGSNLILVVFLFKIFSVLAHVGSSFLVYRFSSNKIITFLYAFNPVILFEFVVNGHNDSFMVLLLLLSLYFFYKKELNLKNFLLSIMFLSLSVLIKFITILFLPFFLLYIFKYNKFSVRTKFKYLFYSSLTFLLTLILFYLPFWRGIETFSRIILQTKIFFLSMSPGLMVSMLVLNKFNLDKKTIMLVSPVFQLMFIAFCIVFFMSLLFFKKNISKKLVVKYLIIVLTIFYSVFFSCFVPWYLPLLLLLLLLGFYIYRKKLYIVFFFYTSLYGIFNYFYLR